MLVSVPLTLLETPPPRCHALRPQCSLQSSLVSRVAIQTGLCYAMFCQLFMAHPFARPLCHF